MGERCPECGMIRPDHKMDCGRGNPPREERGKPPVLFHPEGWRSDGQLAPRGNKI